MKDIETIKLIVELTMAKVSILKLNSDDYVWNCFVAPEDRENLMQTVNDIDNLLTELRGE